MTTNWHEEGLQSKAAETKLVSAKADLARAEAAKLAAEVDAAMRAPNLPVAIDERHLALEAQALAQAHTREMLDAKLTFWGFVLVAVLGTILGMTCQFA